MFITKVCRNVLLYAVPVTLIAATVAMAQPAKSHRFINILTATTGGVFYPLGSALSTIFAREIPGSRPSVQATKGTVDNMNLMQKKRGEVAFAQADGVIFAWEGNKEHGFKSKVDTIRGMTAIYTSYIQIVATKESGIKTIADLKGKRLSVGAHRSGTELTTRAFLRAAGISYADLAKVEHLPFFESVDLMKNRRLDATLQTAGLGVPALTDFANAFPMTVVEIPPEIVERVGPPYIKATIPKGTYKGQDTDVPAAGLPNFLITRADVPDDLVYAMTKAVFSSTKELAAAHPAAADIKLENALEGMPIPLHPGAKEFFIEKGLLPR